MLFLDYFTENSPQIITIFALYLIGAKLTNFSWTHRILLLVGIVLILFFVLEVKEFLKCILGRNWPAYWLGMDNPYRSPYGSNYGFHFHLSSKWPGSMPSGHTSYIGSLSMMLWFLFPRVRAQLVVFSVLLVIALIMLNHHYLGDCFAGFALAALINPLFILYNEYLSKLLFRNNLT